MWPLKTLNSGKSQVAVRPLGGAADRGRLPWRAEDVEEARVWWAGSGPRVLALCRDVANPAAEADPYFASFRHKMSW